MPGKTDLDDETGLTNLTLNSINGFSEFNNNEPKALDAQAPEISNGHVTFEACNGHEANISAASITSQTNNDNIFAHSTVPEDHKDESSLSSRIITSSSGVIIDRSAAAANASEPQTVASISRRRGASITVDLPGNRGQNPGPSRRVSLPLGNDGYMKISESDIKLLEYGLSNEEKIDKKFVTETERVVRGFLVSTYERDSERQYVIPSDEETTPESPSPGTVNDTPLIPELFEQAVPDNNAAVLMISRRLALIADEMDARYGNQIDRMVALVLPGLLAASDAILNNAYDIFHDVACNIFQDGRVTWCRIVTLLSFSYRLGIALFRHGMTHFVRMVVRLVTKFILREHIYRWIMQRGGWLAALTANLMNDPTDISSRFIICLIWGATALTLTCLAFRHLMNNGAK